jgi:hypothetical protein
MRLNSEQQTMAAFTQVDFPHIRSKLACPACNRARDKGTLVCWPCYRVLDMRHGMRPDIAARFEALEAFLAACDERELRARAQPGTHSFADPELERARLKLKAAGAVRAK